MDIGKFGAKWDALWAAARDTSQLEDLARDLGHEVGRKGLSAARLFLSRFGETDEDSSVPELVTGFRLALLHYVSAYESARRGVETEAELEEFAVHAGWLRILRALDSRPLRPGDLVTLFDVDMSSASRTFSQMRKEGLVEVIPSSNRKEKPHRLTLRGERIVRNTKGIDEGKTRITLRNTLGDAVPPISEQKVA